LNESSDNAVLSAHEITSAGENQAPSPVADALAFKDIRAAGVEKAGSTEALLEPRTEMVKVSHWVMASWRRNLFCGGKLLRALALGHLIQGCDSLVLMASGGGTESGPIVGASWLELHLKSWSSCLCACVVAIVRLLIPGAEHATKVAAHISTQCGLSPATEAPKRTRIKRRCGLGLCASLLDARRRRYAVASCGQWGEAKNYLLWFSGFVGGVPRGGCEAR
jgi:hypothetical protein